MSAGTTVRFALLVALLLVTSGGWMLSVTRGLSGSGAWGCSLAAGIDPLNGSDLAVAFRTGAQRAAYDACLARYQRLPPEWVIVVWPALVLVTAGGLFWALPRWRSRRGRVVPLEKVDRDGEVRDAVEELATRIGLKQTPRVVVDPLATSASAVVFGSNSRPTVCLHGGLLLRRAADPDGFRAVVLHELAHIRNGDITVTYATIAIWRVFLAMVLLPYLAWYARQFARGFESPFWPSYAPTVTWNFAVAMFLVVLMYLARSDVLRSREIYADLAAVRCGANPRSWAAPAPGAPPGGLRRTLAAFAELWRSHPRWDLRRASLTDPAPLFSVPALPMFLTGAAITMIIAEVTGYLKQYDLGYYGMAGSWEAQAVQLFAPPALVVGVAGVALWRAVAYAVLTSGRAPSGVRAGLWLGLGMAVTELGMREATIYQWVPSRMEALGLVVLVAVVITWWIGQCAQLWVRTWRGRTIGPWMRMTLAAAVLALASWFVWWQFQGTLLLAGVRLAPDELRRVLTQEYPAVAADHPLMTWAVNVALSTLSITRRWPLFLAAITALWVVPLLAWVLRPRTTNTTSWVSTALSDSDDAEPPAEPLPTLRRVLLPGLLGGVLCWAVVAGVHTYMHGWPANQRNALYLHIYLMWALLAMAASAAVAAAVASVLARHYRLLVALIAGHVATLVGFAGFFALASFDGCVQPLSTLFPECAWRPGLTWSMSSPYLALTLVASTVVAIAAAAVVSMARRVWSTTALPLPRPPAQIRRTTARRVCVALTCAVAVALTATLAIDWDPRRAPWWSGEASPDSDEDAAGAPDAAEAWERLARSTNPFEEKAPSELTRTMQMAAWRDYGGEELLGRFGHHWGRLTEALPKPATWAQPGHVDLSGVRPVCADIGQTAREARRYFRIPDSEGQQHWQWLIARAEVGSRSCETAVARQDRALFLQSIKTLTQAADSGLEAYKRVEAVSRRPSS
ncbi:M48 family metallopeptidase [Streptoalloteichus tenebrarius]|nr:M48 family metalloprotease [Streptoalloteichus tenebrarius]